MFSRNNFSVWSILKKCIGLVRPPDTITTDLHVFLSVVVAVNSRVVLPLQELSKITMPIVFNEPLSFLQRISEYMEHTYLINRACSESDSVERMQVDASTHTHTPVLEYLSVEFRPDVSKVVPKGLRRPPSQWEAGAMESSEFVSVRAELSHSFVRACFSFHQSFFPSPPQAVAAFAVSAVASQWDRTGKPFNPLLGETYELTR